MKASTGINATISQVCFDLVLRGVVTKAHMEVKTAKKYRSRSKTGICTSQIRNHIAC